jgi:hypothetical protein
MRLNTQSKEKQYCSNTVAKEKEKQKTSAKFRPWFAWYVHQCFLLYTVQTQFQRRGQKSRKQDQRFSGLGKLGLIRCFEWSIGFGLGKFRRHDEKAD